MNRKQKKQQEKTAKRNTAHEEKEQAKYQALVTRLEEGKPLTPKQISFAALHLTSIWRQRINVIKMTMNARIVASCGLHMSTSIPKGRRNGANVRVASFGFATLATYLLTSGNAVIRRRKVEEMTTQIV